MGNKEMKREYAHKICIMFTDYTMNYLVHKLKDMREGNVYEVGSPWFKGNLYRWTLIVAFWKFPHPAEIPPAVDNHLWILPLWSLWTSYLNLCWASCLNPEELLPRQSILFFSYWDFVILIYSQIFFFLSCCGLG